MLVILQKEKSKEQKRIAGYWETYQLAKEERNGSLQGLATRWLIECKDCSAWCKRNGKDKIMWPMWPATRADKKCPLCQECELTRVSIV